MHLHCHPRHWLRSLLHGFHEPNWEQHAVMHMRCMQGSQGTHSTQIKSRSHRDHMTTIECAPKAHEENPGTTTQQKSAQMLRTLVLHLWYANFTNAAHARAAFRKTVHMSTHSADSIPRPPGHDLDSLHPWHGRLPLCTPRLTLPRGSPPSASSRRISMNACLP